MARNTHRIRNILLTGTAWIAFAGIAHAQDASSVQATATAPTSDAKKSGDDITTIVVTGTHLRGVAPIGTNVVDLSSSAILQTGAASSNEILAQLPQVTSAFNSIPSLSSTDTGTAIVRPNLRNLAVAQGGTTTLILIDGHRAVGAGVLETTPDPDVIPASVLDRVDVMLDGGSSLYGSDAVGGVINYVTKTRFDGFQVGGHYGLANHYSQYDVNATIGKDWGKGSAYIAWDYADNTALFGRDRSYVKQFSGNGGTCPPGNITENGITYALPGLKPNTLTTCDTTNGLSIIPANKRNSIFASFVEQLTDNITFDAKVYNTHRVVNNYIDQNSNGTGGQSVTITSSNPYYQSIGAGDTGTQQVGFSYGGLLSNNINNVLSETGVTGNLTINLDENWRLKATGNFGESSLVQTQGYLNAVNQSAAAAGTTLATALDPYNPSLTNSNVLASIVGDPQVSRGNQKMADFKAILDGKAFELPGGYVRVAFGVESEKDDLRNAVNGGWIAQDSVSRTINSAFVEVAIPVVSTENAVPGIYSLDLSVSGRYDHYSDFGGTSNPKLGFTYKPVRWVSIRGDWGTSFDAPSLADKGGAVDTRFIAIPGVSPWIDPAGPASNGSRPEVIIAGGNPNLKPQTAKTWSFGFDVKPPVVEGLTLSATYYNVKIAKLIGIIPIFTSPNVFLPVYSQWVYVNPTLSQAQSLAAGMPLVGTNSVSQLYTSGGSPNGNLYAILDARRNNLGFLNQDGIDYNAAFAHGVGNGTLIATVGGTYTLSNQTRQIGQPWTNGLKSPGMSRYAIRSSVSYETGALTGAVTWRYTAGYKLGAAQQGQTSVDGFSVVDAYFKYQLGSSRDTYVTLNIDNVFDQNPPLFRNDPGYTNGQTLGRLIEVGLNKRF